MLDKHGSHPDSGLTEDEAEKRLLEHGPNELKERPRPGFLSLLFNDRDGRLLRRPVRDRHR